MGVVFRQSAKGAIVYPYRGGIGLCNALFRRHPIFSLLPKWGLLVCLPRGGYADRWYSPNGYAIVGGTLYPHFVLKMG